MEGLKLSVNAQARILRSLVKLLIAGEFLSQVSKRELLSRAAADATLLRCR
jgi:hypothetical protein